jgi:hypothetical protein
MIPDVVVRQTKHVITLISLVALMTMIANLVCFPDKSNLFDTG